MIGIGKSGTSCRCRVSARFNLVKANVTVHQHRIGLSRREALQAGYSGLLGLGLPSLLAGRARADVVKSAGQAGSSKSMILVFLTGAASHHDTFDMKPDAPAEIRGEFKPIADDDPRLRDLRAPAAAGGAGAASTPWSARCRTATTTI